VFEIQREGFIDMRYCCHIVPKDVLDRFAEDTRLSDELREGMSRTSRVSDGVRTLRVQAGIFTTAVQASGAQFVQLAAAPTVTVYDCKQTQTPPGTLLVPPYGDPTAKRAFAETTKVANFYQALFGRNSIDNAGMTMMSSIHFGVKFNNALWNGAQMIYGDGDGQIFIDFTNGNDVIGHELTHGVTQNTLQLAYKGDAGGLNESLSDCFGSMFRQWEAGQDANSADWLIGSTIMGPMAIGRGFTCLRDMANPAATHCLNPQPINYSQLTPSTDPHYASGPPNLAFCVACKTKGGNSWEKIGQVWYATMTGTDATPNMTMPDFANRTRQVARKNFPADPTVFAAVDKGWKQVGL
jgi:Zn-dependent metalloprotease